MKAYIHNKYGQPDVLEVEEIDKPVPAEDEVLVRVRATSVNPAEWYGMTGLYIVRPMTGLLKPKDTRLGADFAGVVEAVGANVRDFKPGDEVFGGKHGAFAEYVCVRDNLASKPENFSFEEAAALPIAAITALQGLRDHGKIKEGAKVLINGASGGVGTYAVQIAKAFGAEVAGVCSTDKVELVRSLGADRVIDYTKEDFTKSAQRYDLLLDIAGSRSWSEYKRVLNPDAAFVIVGVKTSNRWLGPLAKIVKLRLGSLRASQKVSFFIANFNRQDFEVLKELCEAGKVKSVIERSYPFSELPEAMRHLGRGHLRGKIVVSVAG